MKKAKFEKKAGILAATIGGMMNPKRGMRRGRKDSMLDYLTQNNPKIKISL